MGLRGNGCVLALRHLPSISPVRLSEKKQPVSSELMLEATSGVSDIEGDGSRAAVLAVQRTGNAGAIAEGAEFSVSVAFPVRQPFRNHGPGARHRLSSHLRPSDQEGSAPQSC